MAQGLMTWIDTVEEESGGSIEIQLYPGGQLAIGTDAIVNGIQTGAFDVAHFVTGNRASYTDAFAELNVPYLYEDYDTVQKVLTSDIGESMKEKLQQDVPGIQPLAFISIGFRNVTANRSVHQVEDMKGLKIRTMDDPLQIAAMEAMEAAVTSVNISELYNALQTGMVDAEENPLSTIDAQKFYEVNPYITLTRHSYTSTFLFMNEDKYQSLSDNQKAAIEKANEAAMTASQEAAEQEDETYSERLLSEGAKEVYQPTDEEMAGFRDAVKPVWEKAESEMGQERYQKLLDTLGIEQLHRRQA